MGKDKVMHFSASAAAALMAGMATSFLGLLPAVLCGSLFSLGLGLGKEYGDSRAPGNVWSWGDILADLLGVIAGDAVLFLLHKVVLWPGR